jgi:zinc transporter ZupT
MKGKGIITIILGVFIYYLGTQILNHSIIEVMLSFIGGFMVGWGISDLIF